MNFGLKPIDLASLNAHAFTDKLMTPAIATAVGPAVASEIVGWCAPYEEAALRQFIRDASWISEDGSHQPIRLLAFPQSDRIDEVQRAAFAPSAARLAPAHVGKAYDAAFFARAEAGGQPDVWRQWAVTASMLLEQEGRRIFKRDDGLEVKTPTEWAEADYALDDRYTALVFDRSADLGRAGAARLVGVGHRLFDTVLAHGEQLRVSWRSAHG